MEHQKAKAIADRLLSQLGPYCERIEIAGSVRRGKPDVKDIEIVAVPKITEMSDMFGNSVSGESEIDVAVRQLVQAGARLIKNGPRYKQIALPAPDGINLDLFLVLQPAQFDVLFAIRTGPAEFSKWLVTPCKDGGALPSHCRIKDGAVLEDGAIMPMPEESDFFSFLGLGWIEPGQRQAGWHRGQAA
jgi:DNA polymerase/3'-5' exonuclease PolX